MEETNRTVDPLPPLNEKAFEFVPASLAKRIIAFAMDSVLLFILIQLAAVAVPKFYSEKSQKEFNKLTHQLSLLGKEERFDSTKITTFFQDSGLSMDTYNMIMSMFFIICILPIIYFFCGESFFKGQTLGKATFGLQTKMLRDFETAPKDKIFIRSTLKGIATITLFTPFLLPGILNFCFCLFNNKKRCVHDILSGTITVQPSP